MRLFNVFCSCEIGDRAGKFDHAVIRARREIEPRRRTLERFSHAIRERRVPLEVSY